MSPHHPAAELAELTEETLRPFAVICLDDTSIVLPKRHNGHFPQQRRLLLPNWFSAIECLKNGVGVGFMPRHIANPLLASGELVVRALPEHQPLSNCCMVWSGDEDNRLLNWLVNYLGDQEKLYRDWLKAD